MYDVAHIFLRWLVYKFVCERHVEADFFVRVKSWCDRNFVTLPEGKFG